MTPMSTSLQTEPIPVTIKWSPLAGHWSICHARSEQNAFRSEINRFDTERQASDAARERGCEVVRVNEGCGKTCGAPCVECLPQRSILRLETEARLRREEAQASRSAR